MALHKDYPALYQQIHWWARKNVSKPKVCSRCGKNKKLELSNNGKYSLDVNDWEWVCRSCHANKDGWNKKVVYTKERMEKLWSKNRGRKPWNFGLKATEETKKKLSLSHMGQRAWNRGKPMSEESKQKLSQSLKGKIPWNKGHVKMKLNESYPSKLPSS